MTKLKTLYKICIDFIIKSRIESNFVASNVNSLSAEIRADLFLALEASLDEIDCESFLRHSTAPGANEALASSAASNTLQVFQTYINGDDVDAFCVPRANKFVCCNPRLKSLPATANSAFYQNLKELILIDCISLDDEALRVLCQRYYLLYIFF